MNRKNLKFLFCLFAVFLLNSQQTKAQLEESRLVISDGIRNESLKSTIEKNVSNFLYSCNSAVMKGEKPKLDKNGTTEDARKRFVKIWETSPLSCDVSTIERLCLVRPAGGYQIRNIPVTMYEAPENEQNQEIIFNITADGRVDDVFIPIDQYSDLISANIEEEDIDLRIMVLDFVENFRTAYNRKDLSFLETVFSNNAIIIVGKEIKQKPKSDSAIRSLSGSKFEYQVKTKGQYLTALKNVFKVNKYIAVDFSEIKVLQHETQKEVYGVTLKQVWDSSTLKNETGYVFLLIDFRDELHPEIHVRTWQPTEYEGRKLRRDEIFQIGDFNLNRFN